MSEDKFCTVMLQFADRLTGKDKPSLPSLASSELDALSRWLLDLRSHQENEAVRALLARAFHTIATDPECAARVKRLRLYCEAVQNVTEVEFKDALSSALGL